MYLMHRLVICHVQGVTCHKRPCAYANFWDHVKVLRKGLLRYILHAYFTHVRQSWGGVGVFTFLEHAHMFLHPCLMLRNRWGWGGVGWFTFLEHAHMFLHSCLMQYVHRWQWSRSCDIDLFTSLDQACKKLHR